MFGLISQNAPPKAGVRSFEAQLAEVLLPGACLFPGIHTIYCLARRHFCRSTVFAVAWSVPASNDARPSKPANPAWSKLK